jgi:uncharacterized membrane protein YfcA
MLLALPLALLIGLTLGTIGGGGAVLTVPLLVYVVGEDVHAATTASLALVLAASLAGGLLQARNGMVCWGSVAAFAPGLIAGSFAGTALNQEVGAALLLGLFALVILAAAVAMWRKANLEGEAPEGIDALRAVCPPVYAPRALLAGITIGVLTGFFGVGGGFVIVPALALWLGFAMRAAVGTSLVVVCAASLVSLVLHLDAGASVDWAQIGPLAAAMVAGTAAGVIIANRVRQATLARGFAVLLAALAGSLLIGVAVAGAPT